MSRVKNSNYNDAVPYQLYSPVLVGKRRGRVWGPPNSKRLGMMPVMFDDGTSGMINVNALRNDVDTLMKDFGLTDNQFSTKLAHWPRRSNSNSENELNGQKNPFRPNNVMFRASRTVRGAAPMPRSSIQRNPTILYKVLHRQNPYSRRKLAQNAMQRHRGMRTYQIAAIKKKLEELKVPNDHRAFMSDNAKKGFSRFREISNKVERNMDLIRQAKRDFEQLTSNARSL